MAAAAAVLRTVTIPCWRAATAMLDLYTRKAQQAEKARRKRQLEAERKRVAEAKADADRRDYRCVHGAASRVPGRFTRGTTRLPQAHDDQRQHAVEHRV